jgi:PAT family beta-lactamase induction signal transducer AmpG
VSVTGYRIAMLVSGAVALILSEIMGWHSTYFLIGGLMLIGVGMTMLSPEPAVPISVPHTLSEALWGPIREFFSRRAVVGLVALIVLYKLGDAFAGSLTTTFLIRAMGFSPGEVGVVNKGMGLAATIVGALVGGAMMARLGLFRSLLLFGALQAASNLSFMVLAWAGKSYVLMVSAVAFENITGGMGTSAFVALMMSLCDHRYTATQYAALSACAALGRVFVGPPSGYVVEAVGWVTFFFITFVAAMPGLLLLWRLRTDLRDHGVEERQAVSKANTEPASARP